MVGFGLAVVPVCLAPGVSFTLVTQRVLDRGAHSGLAVIAGTACGLICHATLAGVGLSALVMRSSEAFTVVKLTGAGYLIALGIRSLWRARRSGRHRGPANAVTDSQAVPWHGHGDFVQGFLGNVLNPKAAAVYLTVAPQFLHTGSPLLVQMLQLCAAHVIVAAGWLLIWTTVVHMTRRSLRPLSFRRVVERVSGVTLIGLGLRTVVTVR
jgi:threonine/homoserine/homoserine lactone efflux protein